MSGYWSSWSPRSGTGYAQVLTLATRLLGNEAYDDFDGGLDTIAGYHSPLRGLNPNLDGFEDRATESRELVAAIRLWLESGVEPHGIAVLSRTKRQSEEAVGALAEAGIPAVRLKGSGQGKGSRAGVDHAPG